MLIMKITYIHFSKIMSRTQLSVFFQFVCPLHHFIIIRRYSRAYVVLVYSDFSGGWNRSARGLVHHRAPTAQQILVGHVSRCILLLQRNPWSPTLSPVLKHLSTDGLSITPPGTHPHIPAPISRLLKAQGISFQAWDEHLHLVPTHSQGCLSFLWGKGRGGSCCVDLVIPGALLQVFKGTSNQPRDSFAWQECQRVPTSNIPGRCLPSSSGYNQHSNHC